MARILIIEDNEVNRELMTYLLQSAGHQTLHVDNGEDGVEQARRERPDMVLCDILLPGIDGHEVARVLRADAELAHVRLVAVTAQAMVGDRELALQAGFHAYVTKPIDPRDFVDQVERLMPGFGGQAPAPSGEAPSLQQGDIPPPLQAPAPGLVVLLVDDRRNQLELKRDLLEPAGYTVQATDQAEQAWAWLRDHRVDLIVSDVVMPGTDGLELLSRVRRDVRLSTLPFIFLTSTARDSRSMQDGLARGANAYLIRPIEPAALLQAIRRLLPEPPARG